MGDDKEGSPNAPKNGDYRNALVEYEASNAMYIYSSDGIPTKLGQSPDEIKKAIDEAIAKQKIYIDSEITAEERSRIDEDGKIRAEMAEADDAIKEEYDSKFRETESELNIVKEDITTVSLSIDSEAESRKDADNALSERIDAITEFRYKVVDELPEEGESGVIYLVPQDREAPNTYDEFMWIDGKFEKIGDTKPDLTDYVKRTDYATSATAGVIKAVAPFGVEITGSGELKARVNSYADYPGVWNDSFISKGTLENVLNGRKYLMPEYTQELPTAGEDNKLYLVPAEEQPDVVKRVSGKVVEIADASEGDLIDWTIKGDTEQTSYTGKNKLDMTKDANSSGVTVDFDGVTMVLSGTCTNQGNNRFFTVNPLPAGTYTLTIDKALPFVVNVRAGQTQFRIPAGSTSITATTSALATDVALYIGLENGTTYTQSFKIQLTAGSDADYDFEPYVGGTASPNPDYPQEVRTVTGRQTVSVAGKNLIDKTKSVNGNIIANSKSEALTPTNLAITSDWFSVEPNTVYVVSGERNRSRWQFKDKDGNIISNSVDVNPITTPSNAVLARVYYWFSDSGAVAPTDKNVQVEKGSVPTSYQPYSGQDVEIDLGKNLFNNSEIADAMTGSTSGTTVTPIATGFMLSAGSGVSPNMSAGAAKLNDSFYTKIEPNTTYTFSFDTDFTTSSAYLIGYSYNASTGKHVKVIQDTNQTKVTFNVPYDNILFRFSSGSDAARTFSNIQLERGEKATEYAQYISGIGRNLFDKDNAEIVHLYNAGSGTSENAQAWSIVLPVEPNTTYTYSNANSSLMKADSGIAFYASKPIVGGIPRLGTATLQQSSSVTFTTPSETRYLLLYYRWTTSDDPEAYSKLQIEKGSQANSYAPFIKPELCRLGDYKDRIFKDGDTWKIEKNIMKRIFNGNDSDIHPNGWFNSSETTSTLQVCAMDVRSLHMKYSDRGDSKMTHFVYKEGTLSNGQYKLVNDASGEVNHIRIGISKDIAPDLDSGKEWIVENRPEIYAILLNPVVETITNQNLIDQLNELETLTTVKGYNRITTDTPSVQPFLEFGYYRPDPTVTKEEWLWVENHYEQIGGQRKYSHNLSVNHSTAQGLWDYTFQVTDNESQHYTQLAQIAKYMFNNHAGMSVPVSGTYTEGNDIYILTKISAYAETQVMIEMRKLSDGSIRRISTGAIPVSDNIS